MSQKGRPKKIRKITSNPPVIQFSPRGKPGRPDEVVLTLDQYEALKFADFEGLDQTQGAAKMAVSRATFGRILRQSRHQIADAIVNGKIIRIIPPAESANTNQISSPDFPVKSLK